MEGGHQRLKSNFAGFGIQLVTASLLSPRISSIEVEE